MSDPAVVVTPESTATPASPTPSPASPAAPSTPTSPSFTYPEDRSNWIPLERGRAMEAATNRAAQEVARYRAELDQERRRVQALAGVNPPNPEERNADEVRQALYALVPQLSKLTPEAVDRLIQLAESGDQLQEVTAQHWDHLRDQTLRSAHERVASLYGQERLSETQAEVVRLAFVAMSKRNPDARDPQVGPYNTKFRQRYEAGDPSLVDELVNEIKEDFFVPAQRLAVTPIAQRRPVPRSGPGMPVATAQAKPNYGGMKSVREILDAAEREAEALGR